MRRGPSQDVHFSTRSLIWVHQKVVRQNFSQFYNKFHIKTVDDTIQSLNFVVGQILKKSYSCLVETSWHLAD